VRTILGQVRTGASGERAQAVNRVDDDQVVGVYPATEGGCLRRGGWCRWRLAVALACVVAGVLWAVGPASAASRKWTVLNYTHHDLRLEFVEHVRGAPFGFEGRPEKGSFLDAARPDVLSKPERPTQQHFELTWGPDSRRSFLQDLSHAPVGAVLDQERAGLLRFPLHH
jgi:hypothetical protein